MTEYKYPNYKIQGGCADILRFAIHDITRLMKANAKGNSKLLLPIHDELVFQMDECDMGLIPEIKRIMIMSHRAQRHLAMDCSIAVGTDFHNLEDYNG